MGPRFLSLDEVLSIHADQVGLYGGGPGVRGRGLLESALAKPQQGNGGRLFHETAHSQAAAYLFHIVRNHPFVDGNKRTGTVAALVFLTLNKQPDSFDESELEALVLAVASGEADKSDAEKFLLNKGLPSQ